MSAGQRMRAISRRLGLDVTRYPRGDRDFGAFRCLVSPDPDVIIDVGANDGGFARQARRFGFRSWLVSFEPGSAAFARLTHAAQSDPKWMVQNLALSDQDEQAVLNIAGNAGASSSLLPMLSTHTQAAPGSAYVTRESVQAVRLDDWYDQHRGKWIRPALKIDVQGGEKHVLAGTHGLLDRIVSIQCELSLVHLYEGSWLWQETVAWLEARGFTLSAVTPGFTDPRTGRMLQFDGVFLRRA